MNNSNKSKLEIVIISLLFTLLIYLTFSNLSYKKDSKLHELNEVINKQNKIIENYKDIQELSELIKKQDKLIESYKDTKQLNELSNEARNLRIEIEEHNL